ncbi:tyrosine-protein kinase receptor [Elysia marginata]|uniref:Tyrosine-protein kinase receptor n=1 Tax=Elysia marginata TaxID=1093978 RepID=A0AAV4FG14_9GAST|nr:tyrosine-protein kinase receptor [Elysia marginata]
MDRAVIKWDLPPTLDYQGEGAWSNWTYELHCQRDGDSDVKKFRIEERSLNLTDLRPDTVYTVTVRASSQAGNGPWSKPFVGRTLKADGLSVLMGLYDGEIVLKDISDGSKTTVVNVYSYAIDIDWYEDIILWVSSDGALSYYNQTSRHKRRLTSSQVKVSCLAYDWIGRKVYWSEPDLGAIRRSDLTGINSDYVRQVALANDLAVDAVGGHLYWTTPFKIEASRLHGDEHVNIFSVPFFTGTRVISLTLDFESKKVLWYVQGFETQNVYMADLLSKSGSLQRTQKLGDFRSISKFSGLSSFSQRLFWLTERNQLVTGDFHCNYTSSVSFSSNLTAFSVKHPDLHIYPAGVSPNKLQVVPNPVRSEDIRPVGEYSRFKLTWPPALEVTHGTVFYKVSIIAGSENQSVTTTDNWREISGLSPYTQMVVSIQPYTYWGFALATTLSVRSPMSDVYITQHKNASTLQQTLAADFHWMTPALTCGVLSYHYVNYWRGEGDESTAVKKVVKMRGTDRRFLLTNLAKSETYQFKVQACTETGCGPFSDTVVRKTDALNPIPTLLVASSQGLSRLKLLTKMNSTSLLGDVKPESVTFLAQESDRLFWLDYTDKLCENSESPFEELADLNAKGKALTIDWISRTVYTVESAGPGQSHIKQYNIDRGGHRQLLSRPAEVGSIVADPYTSSLVWTETAESGNGKGYIMAADTRTGQARPVLGQPQEQAGASSNSHSRRSSRDTQRSCSCSRAVDVAPVLAMNYKPQNGATELFFVDKISNTIYSTDLDGCNCFAVFQPDTGEDLGLPPDLLAVDHMRLSWYNKGQGRLYSVLKDAPSDRRLLTKDMAGVKDIIGFGSHLQPLPDSQCLQPGAYNSTVRQIIEKSTSIRLLLSDPIRPEACKDISHAKDRFTVYYRKAKFSKPGAAPEDCQDDRSLCSKAVTYTSEVELSKLEPFTQYLIQVAVSNYYTKDSEELSEPMLITTKVGAPSPARNVNIVPLTPETINVQWQHPTSFNGPFDDVKYIVKYSFVTSEGPVTKQNPVDANQPQENNFISKPLLNLTADQEYMVKVLTCRANRTLCSESAVDTKTTFKTPSNFTCLERTPDSITFTWRSPPGGIILRHQVIYAEKTPEGVVGEWLNYGSLSHTESDRLYSETVTGLTPNTLYSFKIRANYNARPFHKALYLWPSGKGFERQTAVSKPDQPMPPSLTHLKAGGYEVTWAEPESNGATISTYVLEYRNVKQKVWKEAYNGSIERWLVDATRLIQGESYIFRVAALNSQGQGPFSGNSSVMLAPYVAESNSQREVVIACAAAVVIFSIIVIIVALILVTRKRREKIKPPQLFIRGPDTELATLRELPPHTTIEQNNTLYAISIQCTDEEIAKLPHFSRSQLVLTMFLGGGAFGEVYEGLARNILGDGSGETRCAVKTLRKSASENEKEEFLKEALLMKNFQHEHILGLLGVCLDNDPQFIIMELMEGGDLLSFLRSCRATSTQSVQLLLPDLVKVCVHVARGCKYLEDMHFVHRDLAARNCLVSTKNPKTMTVKIGDFGLARDIYKNDYYRKEGEGLLPVRWMSPESLVDGFFTTQSDIWAFGILMWEVVTLGQKPYPARNNIEVLHFVRDQGKPERPDNCADEMYGLMKECWSFNADDRPSFGSLLEHLELYQDKCAEMTDLEIAQLSPTAIDANACVTPSPRLHPHPHHHHNAHRPLPLTPPSFPLLDPPPGIRDLHHLYYSSPWDVPTPYSKPWDPSFLSPCLSMPSPGAATRNLEQHANPNSRRSAANIFVFDAPDSPIDSSSLYQIPHVTRSLADLRSPRYHDYCQPVASFREQDRQEVAAAVKHATTDRPSTHAWHDSEARLISAAPTSGCPTSISKSNSAEDIYAEPPQFVKDTAKESKLSRNHKRLGHRKKTRKSKNVKGTDDRHSAGSEDNLSCPVCLAETVRNLSERVPYVPMNPSSKTPSQDENSNNIDCKTHNLSSLLCASHSHATYMSLKEKTPVISNAYDRSKQNLVILNASKSKVSSTSKDDSPSPTARSSPDEGIWSPSMAATRKYLDLSENNTPSSKLSRSPSGKFCKKVLSAKVANAKSPLEKSEPSNNSQLLNGSIESSIGCTSGSPQITLSDRGKQAVAVLLRGSRFQYDGAPSLGPSPTPPPCLPDPRLETTNSTGDGLTLNLNNGLRASQSKHLKDRQSRTKLRQQRPAPLAGHTNIAFIDEAANRDAVHSMSEEDQEEAVEEDEEEEEEEEVDEEEALAQGLFTPSTRTTTGGGSVRLTQSARQKRLNDLLGTTDAPEKLVVDLTKIGKKRHLSVEDPKNSAARGVGGRRSAGAASDDRSGSSSRAGFPAAGDYDRSGYLEPRGARGGGRYLELKNYAPELRHLRDPQGNPLVSPSGSAFTPVHVTKRGYHPSHASYTLVSPDEEHADGARQGRYDCGSDVCGVEDPNYLSQHQHREDDGLYGRGGELFNAQGGDRSLYARTRYSASDPRDRQRDDDSLYYRGSPAYRSHSQQQQAAMLAAAANPVQRKFSDQDLYSSTAPYRQRHPSSTSSTATNDHRYASVECNNNLHSNGHNTNIMNNINNNRTCCSRGTSSSRGSSSESGSGNGGPRNGSSGSYHNYSRPADPRAAAAAINSLYAAAAPAHSFAPNSNTSPSKSPSARIEGWANRDLDDVFLDSNENLPDCPSGVDYNRLYRGQDQGHQSSGSRGQVHPEATPFTMIGFEGNQVSLV